MRRSVELLWLSPRTRATKFLKRICPWRPSPVLPVWSAIYFTSRASSSGVYGNLDIDSQSKGEGVQNGTYLCLGGRPPSGFLEGGEKRQEGRLRLSFNQAKVSTRVCVAKLYSACRAFKASPSLAVTIASASLWSSTTFPPWF